MKLVIVAVALIAYFLLPNVATCKEQEKYPRFDVPWVGVSVDPSRIARQGSDSSGCSYAAILNALLFSNNKSRQIAESVPGKTPEQRIKYLRDKFGSKPSGYYGTGQRDLETGKVSNSDMLDNYNDFRQERGLGPLKGTFLERGNKETSTAQLQRIHSILVTSLKKNELPIIVICQQCANWQGNFFDALQANPLERGCGWRSSGAHDVAVCAVPECVNQDGSFSVKCIDSLDGTVRDLFLYGDPRNFGAYWGNGSKSKFIRNRPFVAVAGSAAFLPKTHIWSERTEAYLQYAIMKD